MKISSKSGEPLAEAVEGVIICGFLALSIIYIDDVKSAVTSSVKSCIFTIVPSLFVICVLSSAIINSGVIARALSFFKIDSSIFTAFILGNISGYPIGAKTLRDMLEKNRITSVQDEQALCFSFSSGGGFCLGIISASVFKSKVLGLASVSAVFAANLCLFIFFYGSIKCKSKREDITKASFTDAITSSVASSSYAMISVCSAIVFFSAVIAILNAAVPSTRDMLILNSVLEISNAAHLKCSGLADFVVVTVLLAFGGICVHMQLKSLVGTAFSFKRFYLVMPVRLALTAVFAGVFYLLIQRYLPASSAETNMVLSQSESIVPLICVIGMSTISFTYRRQKSKRAGFYTYFRL